MRGHLKLVWSVEWYCAILECVKTDHSQPN